MRYLFVCRVLTLLNEFFFYRYIIFLFFISYTFRRTVQKDGPNKGRPFYCCSKPRDQGCGFFQWADEEPNQYGGGGGGGDNDG